WTNWFKLLKSIRSEKYDHVVNLQRFGSTGLLTALSGAAMKTGFDKNPFSFLFSKKINHELKSGTHEVDRNHSLIAALTGTERRLPVLYPTKSDLDSIESFCNYEFVCMAPGSVWATKMWPEIRWCELIRLTLQRHPERKIYLLGAPSEFELCERIRKDTGSENVHNLSGEITLLASAALMKKAIMNYVNDSAPMHLASAMNAPVTAIYCSTSPDFGFGPLSASSKTAEVKVRLDCRPCGLHGKKACPLGHFKCGFGITVDQVI
ncbi:MAG: glycosyltransferase family 9 protein, partial [Bacteroidota bacterium]